MPDYDSTYRAHAAYFGETADPLLAQYAHLIRRGGRVLDLGVGQGRNALPLARQGFAVSGVDLSTAAIDVTRERAEAEGLEVDLWAGDFRNYLPSEPFDAVLALGLLMTLTPAESAALVERLRLWTAAAGLLFIVAWHSGDPRCASLAAQAEQLAPGCFRLPNGEVRHYLAPNAILELLPEWQVIHHWEGIGPWHRHGEGEPERHGQVHLVTRNQADSGR